MREPPARSVLLLLHIWWPLALGWSTLLVVERAIGRPWEPVGAAVLLLGIGAAYSLDRVIDGPRSAPRWVTGALAASALCATIAIAWLLPRLALPTAATVPVVGLLALLYPRMKRIPHAKTLAVPLVWTWCAIALPFNDGAWLGWHWLHQAVAAPIFLLLAAGCLLCDLKDERSDRAEGVITLPVALGSRAATHIAVGLALAAGALALIEGRVGVACSAAALSAATLWPAVLATEVVGPLLVDIILTLPGLLIVARVV
ncbi:MAG: hypothetical protein ABI880_12655 [Acidobacteriota bacterium]